VRSKTLSSQHCQLLSLLLILMLLLMLLLL